MAKQKIIIVGAGAAGFFAAINMAEFNKDLDITILEKTSKVLQKVKVSGGGRCNVTHACFHPSELIQYYPRGQKELLGPFHTFMTGDTMEWFENRGVPLKIEEDGRVFPISNSSQSIIDCFERLRKKHSIKIALNQNVTRIDKTDQHFRIQTKSSQFEAEKLLVTTGGNTRIWAELNRLGHHLIDPLPSLFTFNIKNSVLQDLPGISVPDALVSIDDLGLESQGPVLITHWGVSGPAILKMSALAARKLAVMEYQFSFTINWLNLKSSRVFDLLQEQKRNNPKKIVFNKSPFREIPNRLWMKLVSSSQINQNQNWSDISLKQFDKLSQQLTATRLNSHGKTTFKEEFVTAGGVDLKEINFKRFESKLIPDMYFAGEVLNIDGLTGGFNFQNAWTGAFIAAKAISQ